MAKFVLLNYDGCLLPWAMTLKEEGFDVVLVNPRKGETSKTIGEGIVEVSESIPDDPDAYYVLDSNAGGAGEKADELRKAGRKVLGGGEINWKLERDRHFAMEVAASWGMNVPPVREVTASEAFKVASQTEDVLVWKPERDAEASYTFVSPRREDVLLFLEWLSERYPNTKGILQPYIDGIAVSFDCWWNGKEALQWWFLVEDKRFPARGVGENTGCEVSIVSPIVGGEPSFLDVEKMVSWLRDNNIAPGVFGFTVMVDDEGEAHFLEMDPRFGWDVDVTRIPIIRANQVFGDFLSTLADGGSPKAPSSLVAMSVRLSVPPYPYLPRKDDVGAKGVPVFVRSASNLRGNGPRSDSTEGARREVRGGVFLYSARRDGDHYEVADEYGLVGVAVGVGSSVREAYSDLLKSLDDVFAPGLVYRKDVEEVVEDFLTIQRMI